MMVELSELQLFKVMQAGTYQQMEQAMQLPEVVVVLVVLGKTYLKLEQRMVVLVVLVDKIISELVQIYIMLEVVQEKHMTIQNVLVVLGEVEILLNLARMDSAVVAEADPMDTQIVMQEMVDREL